MAESHTLHRISVHQLLVLVSVLTFSSLMVSRSLIQFNCFDLFADVLLWRKRSGSILLLLSSTFLWLLFERAGYNPLTFVANVLLLLVFILFLWAKSASLLNRPLPPVPDLEISEKSIEQAADVIRVWVNRALAVAHEIAVCGNLRVLVQVAALLWLISYIGSLCNFVTFVYIGILLALSVPMLYDKYQSRIDDKLHVVCTVVEAGYRKVDATVLRKIPVSLYKKKKKSQ